MKRLNYRHTVTACCLGSVTMAASTNLPPLLFLIFHESLGVPLGQITLLITLNFLIQLTVDLLAALFADRIGYRPLLVAAPLLSAAGLAALGTLPRILPVPMVGLLIADVLYSLGGGLYEALVSPTVEACPTRNKVAMMGFLHSFYCWGTVAVILLSTAYLAFFEKGAWWGLPLLWAILPVVDAVMLAVVPLPAVEAEAGESGGARNLLRRPLFLGFLVMMTLVGASELSMSQWASAFAESGLRVSKSLGDLAGPCLFAGLMGLMRVFYAVRSERIDLRRWLCCSAAAAAVGYLTATLAPHPAVAFAGCALTGLAVGMLWPGLLSLAARYFPHGGTPLFSICALFGDLGCSLGPTVVGFVAEGAGGALATGLLVAAAFPALLAMGLLLLGLYGRRKGTAE